MFPQLHRQALRHARMVKVMATSGVIRPYGPRKLAGVGRTILDWGIGSNGIWVLVDNGRYSQDYTFRGPMIFVSDDGRLYRTSRRLKFKNGHVLNADSSHITEHWVNPERLTLDEVNECIRELEELIAHERNRQEREEALMSKQLD